METTPRKCPLCGRAMPEQDGFWRCAEHGDWFSYSPLLLVRAPSVDATTPERVVMPWERPEFAL